MRARLVLGVALTAAVVAGCGSDGDSTVVDPASTVATSPGTTATSPSGTTVTVSISNGTVTPTNKQIDATVGQPITLTVNSDAADELHVHSTPDQSFDIEPGQGQMFEFTVAIPGRVALELHELDKTIATLDVRP
ncbi:hypothetical protein ACNHUS_08295 [Actinomycetes bacterium M1A6_2h]